MSLVTTIVNTIISILTYFILIYTLLSYFLDPYHPVRSAMARVAEPMLNPIRKLIPPLGGFDVSPIILIMLIQVIGTLILRILQLIA